MLCHYFRRPPYYRNQPLVQQVDSSENETEATKGQFHVDNLHQVSLMLLVNDLGEGDTHMQYAIGSHLRDLRRGVMMSFEDYAAQVQDNSNVLQCIGAKGTLYIFSATGIPRANCRPRSTRKVLYLNVTTGHNTKELTDDLSI